MKKSRSKMSRWEPWEREVVIKKVQESPNNFEQAFEAASEELGRTAGAVRSQFRTVIRPELKKQKVALTVQGNPTNMLMNSKNTPRRRSPKVDMVVKFGNDLTTAELKEVMQEFWKRL